MPIIRQFLSYVNHLQISCTRQPSQVTCWSLFLVISPPTINRVCHLSKKTAVTHARPTLSCYRKLKPYNQTLSFFIYEKVVI